MGYEINADYCLTLRPGATVDDVAEILSDSHELTGIDWAEDPLTTYGAGGFYPGAGVTHSEHWTRLAQLADGKVEILDDEHQRYAIALADGKATSHDAAPTVYPTAPGPFGDALASLRSALVSGRVDLADVRTVLDALGVTA